MANIVDTLRDASATLAVSDRVLSTAASYHAAASSAAAASASVSASASAAASSSSSETHADRLAACLFLATKMCEEPRRVRDVLNATHLALTHKPLSSSHEYWARKEQLALSEQRLLRALGFDAACADAQVPLLNALRAFDAPRSLYELCVALLNDGSHSLACAGVPSRLRVAAAISVGAGALDVALPADWKRVLEIDGDERALAAACHALLDAYDRPPGSRLASEATEGGSTTRETTPAVPPATAKGVT